MPPKSSKKRAKSGGKRHRKSGKDMVAGYDENNERQTRAQTKAERSNMADSRKPSSSPRLSPRKSLSKETESKMKLQTPVKRKEMDTNHSINDIGLSSPTDNEANVSGYDRSIPFNASSPELNDNSTAGKNQRYVTEGVESTSHNSITSKSIKHDGEVVCQEVAENNGSFQLTEDDISDSLLECVSQTNGDSLEFNEMSKRNVTPLTPSCSESVKNSNSTPDINERSPTLVEREYSSDSLGILTDQTLVSDVDSIGEGTCDDISRVNEDESEQCQFHLTPIQTSTQTNDAKRRDARQNVNPETDIPCVQSEIQVTIHNIVEDNEPDNAKYLEVLKDTNTNNAKLDEINHGEVSHKLKSTQTAPFETYLDNKIEHAIVKSINMLTKSPEFGTTVTKLVKQQLSEEIIPYNASTDAMSKISKDTCAEFVESNLRPMIASQTEYLRAEFDGKIDEMEKNFGDAVVSSCEEYLDINLPSKVTTEMTQFRDEWNNHLEYYVDTSIDAARKQDEHANQVVLGIVNEMGTTIESHEVRFKESDGRIHDLMSKISNELKERTENGCSKEIHDQVTKLTQCMASMVDKMTNSEDKIESIDNTVSGHTVKIDVLEKNDRLTTLILDGLPFDKKTTLIDQVLTLINNRTKLNLTKSDIVQVARFGVMPKDGKPRPVRIRFINDNIRKEILINKGNIKESRISFREHLTERESAIMKQAKVAKTDGLLDSVWTRDGRIYASTDKNTKKLPLFSLRRVGDLNRAREKATPDTMGHIGKEHVQNRSESETDVKTNQKHASGPIKDMESGTAAEIRHQTKNKPRYRREYKPKDAPMLRSAKEFGFIQKWLNANQKMLTDYRDNDETTSSVNTTHGVKPIDGDFELPRKSTPVKHALSYANAASIPIENQYSQLEPSSTQ